MPMFEQDNQSEAERERMAQIIKERNRSAYGGMAGKLKNNKGFKVKAKKSNNPLSIKEVNGRTGGTLLGIVLAIAVVLIASVFIDNSLALTLLTITLVCIFSLLGYFLGRVTEG